MKTQGDRESGYTLLEIAFATTIFMITLAGAISGWLYVLYSERLSSVQNELDIDVRTSMEWLRSDLRLTSMDKVFFYPEGAGPYQALSFPVARDDDGDGKVELDADGHIIWDKTIVYHVWQTVPNQLRVTVFDPRDNSLTDEQRQEQLESVVANGNGDYTYNSQHASTMALFENLFSWNIYTKAAVFDAYSPILSRKLDVVLGSILLDNGSHDFKFRVIGKNQASSGYKVGLDTLVVSPCGAAREAEAQLPPSAHSGANPVAEYMAEGSWSGNYQLSFPATAENQYFTLTMNNDRWEETNFRATGALCEDTEVEFAEDLSPKDFVVRLQGGPGETNWFAGDQTGSNVVSSSAVDEVRGCAVRVLIRGEEMTDGGWMNHDGGNVKLRFDSGSSPLRIKAAYIAECSDPQNPTPDAATDGIPLYFNGSQEVYIPAWSDAWGMPAAGTAFPIEKEKSYLVSVLVSPAASEGTAEYWGESSTNVPGCYMILATNIPTKAMTQQANWSSLPYVVTSRLYIVKYMETTYATNGYFTSQILDTHLDAPQYTDIDWNSEVPSGTGLRLKLRTGNDPELADATDWSNITWMSSPGAVSLSPKRYVQFRAWLTSNNDPSFEDCRTPRLKDVTLSWNGERRITDVGGTVTVGPDYGIFAMTVDGKDLVKGVTIELEIYQDVTGFGGMQKRLTSSMTTEIEPRNTGK